MQCSRVMQRCGHWSAVQVTFWGEPERGETSTCFLFHQWGSTRAAQGEQNGDGRTKNFCVKKVAVPFMNWYHGLAASYTWRPGEPLDFLLYRYPLKTSIKCSKCFHVWRGICICIEMHSLNIVYIIYMRKRLHKYLRYSKRCVKNMVNFYGNYSSAWKCAFSV